MQRSTIPSGSADAREEGCAYPLDGDGGTRSCGALLRPRSSYCSHHHALCHVPRGTRAEARRRHEAEVLARLAGGRRGWSGLGPSRQFLARLEHALRDFF
ncbi:MAG: hypothetical protein ACREFQ_02760 [Stellaceae bacterium]